MSIDNIILEMADGRECGTWFKVKCPFCENPGRPILSIKVGLVEVTYNCFSSNCIAHGMHTISVTPTMRQVERLLNKSVTVSEKVEREYDLPDDYTRQVPYKFIDWLVGYDVTRNMIEQYAIGYSEYYDRLIIPTPSGYVARSLSEKPKWMNFTDYDYILSSQMSDSLVLVEDPISAIRVAEFMPCMCLFGTNLEDSAAKLCRKYKNVIIFLDNDTAGIDGIMKIAGKLCLTNNIKLLTSYSDPKDHDKWELKELLNEN